MGGDENRYQEAMHPAIETVEVEGGSYREGGFDIFDGEGYSSIHDDGLITPNYSNTGYGSNRDYYDE